MVNLFPILWQLLICEQCLSCSLVEVIRCAPASLPWWPNQSTAAPTAESSRSQKRTKRSQLLRCPLLEDPYSFHLTLTGHSSSRERRQRSWNWSLPLMLSLRSWRRRRPRSRRAMKGPNQSRCPTKQCALPLWQWPPRQQQMISTLRLPLLKMCGKAYLQCRLYSNTATQPRQMPARLKYSLRSPLLRCSRPSHRQWPSPHPSCLPRNLLWIIPLSIAGKWITVTMHTWWQVTVRVFLLPTQKPSPWEQTGRATGNIAMCARLVISTQDSSSFHRLDMTLAVAEALNPYKTKPNLAMVTSLQIENAGKV